jgi:hypothetical protein
MPLASSARAPCWTVERLIPAWHLPCPREHAQLCRGQAARIVTETSNARDVNRRLTGTRALLKGPVPDELRPYYLVHQGHYSCRRDAGVLQIQHNSRGCVNAAQLIEAEIAHAVAESTGIDCRGLFSRHPCDAAVDFDTVPRSPFRAP